MNSAAWGTPDAFGGARSHARAVLTPPDLAFILPRDGWMESPRRRRGYKGA